MIFVEMVEFSMILRGNCGIIKELSWKLWNFQGSLMELMEFQGIFGGDFGGV